MSQDTLEVHIRKEAFKFASAHMTFFPDGTKEPLHGHNYTTEVHFQLKKVPFSELIPFSALKGPLKEICTLWDEKVLLPKSCPNLKFLASKAGEIEFMACGKRYVLPEDEVVCLPVENITVESLAEEFAKVLASKLEPLIQSRKIEGLKVRIDESAGQGASFSKKF